MFDYILKGVSGSVLLVATLWLTVGVSPNKWFAPHSSEYCNTNLTYCR